MVIFLIKTHLYRFNNRDRLREIKEVRKAFVRGTKDREQGETITHEQLVAHLVEKSKLPPNFKKALKYSLIHHHNIYLALKDR